MKETAQFHIRAVYCYWSRVCACARPGPGSSISSPPLQHIRSTCATRHGTLLRSQKNNSRLFRPLRSSRHSRQSTQSTSSAACRLVPAHAPQSSQHEAAVVRAAERQATVRSPRAPRRWNAASTASAASLCSRYAGGSSTGCIFALHGLEWLHRAAAGFASRAMWIPACLVAVGYCGLFSNPTGRVMYRSFVCCDPYSV